MATHTGPSRGDVHPPAGTTADAGGTGQPPAWADAFVVDGAPGAPIRLCQVDERRFRLLGEIEYRGDMGLDGPRYRVITEEMRRTARHLSGEELGATDLASVPPFVRWFENTYGPHTPAALIHDHLIVGGRPNAGALGNDAAADRYFRYMLGAVGVPFLKRWIMWAAVAMRTRWAVGGWRRLSLALWILLSAAGIAMFVASVWWLAAGGEVFGVYAWLVLVSTLAAPALAAFLWGRQFAAGVVAAAAAPWLLPPALFAALGYLVYRGLEWLLGVVIGGAGRRSA